MNWTRNLSLCSWTIFQYTTKDDGDVGLAVIFKLLYITDSVIVSRDPYWQMRHFWAIVSMNPYCHLCIHIPHYPHPSPDPNPNPIPNPKPNPNPKSYPNLKLFNE